MENLKCEQNETSLYTPKTVPANGEKKYLECEICSRIYLTGSKLEKHIRTYHGGKEGTGTRKDKHRSKKKFQCDDCLEHFDGKKLLKAHIRTHEQRLFVECDFCETICDNEDKLKEHLKLHPESRKPKDKIKLPKALKCNSCRKKFRTQGSLKNHFRFCNPSVFRCETISDNEDKLKEHLKSHPESKKPKDKIKLPKTIKCDFCRKKFRTEGNLKNHFIFCNPAVLRCEKCYTNFGTTQGLKYHSCPMKDVVYKCNVCNEGFSKKDYLYEHFFVHKSIQGHDLLI